MTPPRNPTNFIRIFLNITKIRRPYFQQLFVVSWFQWVILSICQRCMHSYSHQRIKFLTCEKAAAEATKDRARATFILILLLVVNMLVLYRILSLLRLQGAPTRDRLMTSNRSRDPRPSTLAIGLQYGCMTDKLYVRRIGYDPCRIEPNRSIGNILILVV